MNFPHYTPEPETFDRYVQRILDDSEAEQFEIWLMDHPEALDELKLRGALRDGIKAMGPPETPQRTNWLAWLAWLNWLARPRLAAAALIAVLAVVVGPRVFQQQSQPPVPVNVSPVDGPSMAPPHMAPGIVRLLLPVTRAVSSGRIDAVIALQPQPFRLLLQIEVTPWVAQADQFEVELEGAGLSRTIAELGLARDNVIELAVDSADLTPGVLRVVLRDGETTLANYRISVAPP